VATRSAGILLWRRAPGGGVEVLLAHMGGPFWAHKDVGAWSLPKGEYADDEPARDAAQREWREELGVDLPVPSEELLPLGEVRQRSGKILTAWAAKGQLDPASIVPGTFTLQWPPRSGRFAEFPEVDRVAWWSLDDARARIVAGQAALLDRLEELLADIS
jgi:predicted NUDIX family NTP pyrophosphohydrolase